MKKFVLTFKGKAPIRIRTTSTRKANAIATVLGGKAVKVGSK